MLCPIDDLLDETACYRLLLSALHPDGHAYNHLDDRGREHHSLNHNRREWTRDDDCDGMREVHCNTMEGRRVELRNFLRPFRGVSKWCLDPEVPPHIPYTYPHTDTALY